MSVQVPSLWQELARGMQGRGDVEAAQRGLWRAADDLGYTSGNARNGNYGQATADDVGKFRAAVGLVGAGSNDQIGATLWPELWPYIDAAGAVTFCNQPQAVSSPSPQAKKLPLVYGDTSKGVEACQRALWRALPSSQNARNGNYQDGTADDVEAFRQRYSVNAGDDGKSIGGELWNVLTRWMDDYAVGLVQAWKPAQPPPSQDTCELALQAALDEVGYVEGSGNHTKYGAWYGMDGQPWCAQFVSWCAEQDGSQAFAKGQRYAYVPYIVQDAAAGKNGLQQVSASQAKRGDLVCYDWEGDGVADHVGLVVDPPGSGSSFHTVEGNTSSGTSGSQSNGGGVYQRTRYVSDVVCFARFR
jgi:peptidoglycan hydrolase-like protein with peptidoglycan-binding domain